MPDESDDNLLPEEGSSASAPEAEDDTALPSTNALAAVAKVGTDAAPGPVEPARPLEPPLPPDRADAALSRPSEGAAEVPSPPDRADLFAPGLDGAAPDGPWPPRQDPGADADGGGTPETAAPPTHAEWRQLADEVRRLAAQIAHGRA